MGAPRSSVAISDPVLSNIAIDYAEQELVTMSGKGMGMTPDFIFPLIPHTVRGLTGEYYKFNFNNMLQLGSGLRKNGNYPKIHWDTTSQTYQIEDYGFQDDWDDRDQEAALGAFDYSKIAGRILPQRVLRDYCNDVFTKVTTPANFTADVTNTSTAAAIAQDAGAWDTTSTRIINQVNWMKYVVMTNCGVPPDRMVAGFDVWTNGIVRNDEIKASMQSTLRSGALEDFENVQAVGRMLFGLDMRVDTTQYQSSNPGQSTSTKAYLFGKNVLVYVSEKRMMDARAMRLGFTAVRPREFLRGYQWFKSPHSHYRAVSLQRSAKLVANEAGYLLTSVVS